MDFFYFFRQLALVQFTILIALHLKTQRFARGCWIFNFFKMFALVQFTILIALHLETQRFARGCVGFLNFFKLFALVQITILIALHLKAQRFARGFVGILIFLQTVCSSSIHNTHRLAFETPVVWKRACWIFNFFKLLL